MPLNLSVLGTFRRHGEPAFAYRVEARCDGEWLHFFMLDDPGVPLRVPLTWR